MRPAVVGKDGRTTAIRNALLRSPLVQGDVPILSPGKGRSPSVMEEFLNRAKEVQPDFVFIGPEEPLDFGFVDELESKQGIPCIGPTSSLARLESSKAFTRELIARYGIAGNPEHRVFSDTNELQEYLSGLGDFVIKPDGLTGGKGVKVSGTHLHSVSEGVRYAAELLASDHSYVIAEEKLDGEEFSLMSFSDGTTVVDMPAVQDHKRAFEDDRGPNTGGMGSYSCGDGRLPFLTKADIAAASNINSAVARALFRETGERYKGVLYGGFMATRDGVRVIEYNARFGDPEALNVLSVLRTDFALVCQAILNGTLGALTLQFEPKATVCKYVVPVGYPDDPVKGKPIDLSRVPPESDTLRHYVAALDSVDGTWYLTGSRAIAFVGIGESLESAEQSAEAATSAVRGPVYHRSDIGTRALIAKRCEHMKRLRS
jgi:phosphoribosylamine---glycine ligase